MDDISWSAVETVRSFCLERAAHPGLTSLEWARAVADRVVADCQGRGEPLGESDREQLAWLIGQHLESALAVMPGVKQGRAGHVLAPREHRRRSRARRVRRRPR